MSVLFYCPFLFVFSVGEIWYAIFLPSRCFIYSKSMICVLSHWKTSITEKTLFYVFSFLFSFHIFNDWKIICEHSTKWMFAHQIRYLTRELLISGTHLIFVSFLFFLFLMFSIIEGWYAIILSSGYFTYSKSMFRVI